MTKISKTKAKHHGNKPGALKKKKKHGKKALMNKQTSQRPGGKRLAVKKAKSAKAKKSNKTPGNQRLAPAKGNAPLQKTPQSAKKKFQKGVSPASNGGTPLTHIEKLARRKAMWKKSNQALKKAKALQGKKGKNKTRVHQSQGPQKPAVNGTKAGQGKKHKNRTPSSQSSASQKPAGNAANPSEGMKARKEQLAEIEKAAASGATLTHKEKQLLRTVKWQKMKEADPSRKKEFDIVMTRKFPSLNKDYMKNILKAVENTKDVTMGRMLVVHCKTKANASKLQTKLKLLPGSEAFTVEPIMRRAKDKRKHLTKFLYAVNLPPVRASDLKNVFQEAKHFGILTRILKDTGIRVAKIAFGSDKEVEEMLARKHVLVNGKKVTLFLNKIDVLKYVQVAKKINIRDKKIQNRKALVQATLKRILNEDVKSEDEDESEAMNIDKAVFEDDDDDKDYEEGDDLDDE